MLQRVVANRMGDGVGERRFFVEEDICATVATLRRHRYDTSLFSGSPIRRKIRRSTASMAKRTRNIKELREQVEAAEKQGKTAAGEAAGDKKKAKDGKKKAAAKPKRSKVKVIVRKRMLWGVFSSSLKEEGRFPYAEKDAAEARAADLAARHKRTYFVQPIKEPLPEKVAEEV
jgi:hypothetical protein